MSNASSGFYAIKGGPSRKLSPKERSRRKRLKKISANSRRRNRR